MVRYEIWDKKRNCVGEYYITPMPGCPAVGISHGLQIYEDHRGKGHGTHAQESRIEIARGLGLQVLIATVIEGNIAEEKILQRFGWKPTTMFDNPKTGHRVRFWQKNLNDPYDCGFFSGGGCR